MKQKYSYVDCYKILHSSPDQSFKDIRKTYKRNVQKYHPDRIDKSKQQAAVLKIQQLNAAFNEIEKFYKEHNKLPNVQPTKSVQPNKRPAANKPVETEQKPKRNHATKLNHQHFNKIDESREKSALPKYIVSIAIILTAYIMFYPLLETERVMPPTSAENTIPSSNISKKINLAAMNQAKKIQADQNNIRKLTPGFFTIGSPLGEVIDVQGKPDIISKDKRTLNYGMSKVYLTEGKVSDWTRVKGSPIKARLIIKKNNGFKPASKVKDK